MIKIEITSDTVTDLRKELIALIAGDPTVALAAEINKEVAETVQQIAPAPEKPATRSRAKATDKAPKLPAEVLDKHLPPADYTPPVVDEWESPSAEAPKEEKVTVDLLRAKIAKVPQELKQKVRDLIASFNKADGTPCVTGPDIQEKDYPAIYAAIDLIGK